MCVPLCTCVRASERILRCSLRMTKETTGLCNDSLPPWRERMRENEPRDWRGNMLRDKKKVEAQDGGRLVRHRYGDEWKTVKWNGKSTDGPSLGSVSGRTDVCLKINNTELVNVITFTRASAVTWWNARWNVSQIGWNYFTRPSGRGPLVNIWKGRAHSEQSLGRWLDQPSVYHIQSRPIWFFQTVEPSSNTWRLLIGARGDTPTTWRCAVKWKRLLHSDKPSVLEKKPLILLQHPL